MQTAQGMITRPIQMGDNFDYAERSGAAFLPTFEGNVAVPFLQAIISGLYAGIAVGVIAFLLANLAAGFVLSFDIWMQIKSALVFAAASGFIVAWRSWAGNVGDYKDLLWYREYAEAPEALKPDPKQTIEAQVKVNNNWKHCDLPHDRDNPQALVDFAQAVVNDIAPFSERGAGRYNYGVNLFNELRDNMIKSRLAYWKDPNNKRLGIGLSRGGTALLRSVATNPPPADYEPDGDDWKMSAETIKK